MIGSFRDMVAEARRRGPKELVCVTDGRGDLLDTLSEAASLGLVSPVLISPRQAARPEKLSTGAGEWIPCASEAEALEAALARVKKGKTSVLMQGSVDQKTFVDTILDPRRGLLIRKKASYVSFFESRNKNKLFMITDSYINNFPTLREKQLIIENCLDVARALGIEEPRIAALAAIEQVNPNIPSTMDSAVLSKMSERGQFGRAIIDGPIDIDCALTGDAAARKGLKSPVTGRVDIYLVPDIESGYSLVQLLTFIGKMESVGVLAGTTVPVVLDTPQVMRKNRIPEIALAVLLCGEKDD